MSYKILGPNGDGSEQIPKPGERWHYPGGHTTDNPNARDATVIAVVNDPDWTEDDKGTPVQVVVYRTIVKRGGQKGPHYGVEHLYLWMYSLSIGGWARGPMPKGNRSNDD